MSIALFLEDKRIKIIPRYEEPLGIIDRVIWISVGMFVGLVALLALRTSYDKYKKETQLIKGK